LIGRAARRSHGSQYRTYLAKKPCRKTLTRPAGAGHATSHNRPGHAKLLRHDAALLIVALRHVRRFNTRMPDTGIDFSAPATLRKWPSLNKQRVSVSLGARPYMISEGTLDECIQQFMQLREGQRHLYEIYTVPQSEFVGAILSTEHIVELARLKDFLK
jgi:hypothetical protein